VKTVSGQDTCRITRGDCTSFQTSSGIHANSVAITTRTVILLPQIGPFLFQALVHVLLVALVGVAALVLASFNLGVLALLNKRSLVCLCGYRRRL
jgi:hypothetical protein